MSLGAGIVLLAIGAILAFAVNVHLDFVDLHTVGYILMAAGALGIILGIVLLSRRRSSVSTSRSSIDPTTGDRVRRDERSDDL